MKIEKITPAIAALYLGQKCSFTHPTTGNEIAFKIESVDLWQVGDGDRYRAEYGEFILHLRRLESMTESEAREVYKLATGKAWDKEHDALAWWRNVSHSFVLPIYGSPAVLLKLLEWGFDLFGLIPAGLAKEITLKSE